MSETNEQNILANVRLCDAIKWHPCLYDSKSKVYQMKHAVGAAWQSIANECEETVDNCKLRWRIIRKSYLRSFRNNIPYTRYYLNEYLDFLRPHLPTLALNEAKASKAEDYDIIRLDEDRRLGNEGEDSDNSHKDDGHNDRNDAEDNDVTNDEEIEEYNNQEDNQEEPDVDSDTASAEETLKAARRGRPKGKRSNISTPDIEYGEEDENRSRDENASDNGRLGRRLARTRKANTRYMEFDISHKRNKKEVKAEEKRKVEKRALETCKTDKTESRQLEKRTRQSVESNKSTPTPVTEEIDKSKQIPKKAEDKLPKPKNTETPTAEAQTSRIDIKDGIVLRKSIVKIDRIFSEYACTTTKPKLVDNSTNIDTVITVDRGSQYETDNPRTIDDDFVDSLKPQIALMNTRQKFNFKKKVFQALMEVFDDSTNFANKDELIEIPVAGVPRVDNATSSELRLMRELVSLVTAAKSTPEIVKASLKEATPDDEDIEELITSPDDKSSTQISRTTSVATKKGETMGLPRHILQKVVKVAGSNGGTILAHEGDKRRVYRIYPKGSVPPMASNTTGATSTASIGTFYVTPPKTQMANNTQINAQINAQIMRANTQTGNSVKPITFTTITKSGNLGASTHTTSSIVPSMLKKTICSKTFSSPQVVVARQKMSSPKAQIAQRSITLANTIKTKNSPLQNKVITSTNPTSILATQEAATSSIAYPVQRFSASSLECASKSGLSQIQISQAVSLNAGAAGLTARENSLKAFLGTDKVLETHEGNSGDSSILPDYPQSEGGADEAGNDSPLLVPVNIKDEPIY